MTFLCAVLFWLFALLWGATSLVDIAMPLLDLPIPEQAGWAVDIALGWGNTQTGAAMALMAAAWLCAAGGRPGFAAVGLVLTAASLGLAAASLDPRIPSLLPEELSGPYNALRADLGRLRLGGFLGLALIGAAALLARPGHALDLWAGRAAVWSVLGLLPLAAVLGGAASLALLFVPALIVLSMLALQMSEAARPGGAHALAGIAALLAGLGLLAAEGTGGRVDLRPAFAALPLLMMAGCRRCPAIPVPLMWLHAVTILVLMAYLAPGTAPLFDLFAGDAAPSTLTEIRAALARQAQLRTGAGLALAALTLAGLTLFLWRRQRS